MEEKWTGCFFGGSPSLLSPFLGRRCSASSWHRRNRPARCIAVKPHSSLPVFLSCHLPVYTAAALVLRSLGKQGCDAALAVGASHAREPKQCRGHPAPHAARPWRGHLAPESARRSFSEGRSQGRLGHVIGGKSHGRDARATHGRDAHATTPPAQPKTAAPHSC